MYFIGSGALLNSAIAYASTAGLRVDGACCPPQDAASARLRTLGVDVLECADPNREAAAIARNCSDGIVFSVNNKQLLGDALLSSGPAFFNVHNGLTQRYRGIAEICIFAAVCRGEQCYGATLQRLLPGRRVDSGPIVAQVSFPIEATDRFADVLEKSLHACRQLFEANVANIASGAYQAQEADAAAAALRYRDISAIAAQSEPARLAKACDLGRYAGFFPTLRTALAGL
jgi:methionyl-tRNA formyltransferase